MNEINGVFEKIKSNIIEKIKSNIIDLSQLDGKTLKIKTYTDDAITLVTGHEELTGNVYILICKQNEKEQEKLECEYCI